MKGATSISPLPGSAEVRRRWREKREKPACDKSRHARLFSRENVFFVRRVCLQGNAPRSLGPDITKIQLLASLFDDQNILFLKTVSTFRYSAMVIANLPDVLNGDLYDNSSIEIQYYQLRKLWPWKNGGIHALGWVLFAGGLVLIFGLLNVHDILLDRRRLGYTLARNNKDRQGGHMRERSLFDRILLHLRSFGYLRSTQRRIGATSFGLGLLILVGFAYPTIYVFSQRPYYEMAPLFGPPPLSGRSGMITLAMTPFVLMLGMKANLISLITGVGHEKLNVLHRWLGFFMAFFAVVHTIPFIIEPLRNGGVGQLKNLFSDHFEYWSGVGALICLLWLSFGSLSFIRYIPFMKYHLHAYLLIKKKRAWCYELFVHLHIICGIGYVGLLFWHCGNMLRSVRDGYFLHLLLSLIPMPVALSLRDRWDLGYAPCIPLLFSDKLVWPSSIQRRHGNFNCPHQQRRQGYDPHTDAMASWSTRISPHSRYLAAR